MTDEDARNSADNMLKLLISNQPNLLAPAVPNEANGARLADYIAALRKGLTEMYKSQQP